MSENQDKWQLFVYGIGGKCTVLHDIDPEGTVDTVIDNISKRNGIPSLTMRVLYTSKMLEYGHGYPLSKYKMTNNSNLFVVLRLKGGQDNENREERQENQGQTPETDTEPDRKQHDPLTPLTDLPDMITWDDDKDFKRARMPCGHAIGPESLTAYCRSLLTAGKFEFYCPYIFPENNAICNKKWDFYIVRQYGVLTPDEIKEFEIKITENYMRKAMGLQDCPGCKTICERMNKKDKRMVCPYCSKGQNPTFEFCWMCLKTWKSQNSTTECGNEGCSGRDPRLDILEKCLKKMVVGVMGPSTRACPACGLLIEHTEACKHMACPCGSQFCFLCLKQQTNGSWTCGSYRTPCAVAPVQTTLPGE